MITEQDLQEAIAECQGQRNPTANTCIKLAAFLTIQKELFGSTEAEQPMRGYSFDAGNEQIILYESDSDFGRLVKGKEQRRILKIMDEAMDVMQTVNPNLYAGIMRKIREADF